MGFQLEAGGEQMAQLARAAMNLKDAAAFSACEVVMVGFASEFVTGGFAGKFDCGEPSLIDQRFHSAVDRGHAKAFVPRFGGFVDFGG